MRVKLAAAYRLINPWGLNHDEVTALDLIKIGVEGGAIAGEQHGINFACFVVHSAIHMTRSPENLVVKHKHTHEPT